MRWPAVARPAAAALVVGAAVVAANWWQSPPVLGQVIEPTAAPTAGVVPVRQAVLACPGPETEGLAGVPAVGAVRTTLWAATAPSAVLADLATPARSTLTRSAMGNLRVLARPDGGELAAANARGQRVSAELTGTRIGEISAVGALAPATAALQTSLLTSGDDRGLGATGCVAPRPDVWLLGGGADSTRRERIVVANPGPNALTVDIDVYGGSGKLATASGSRVPVPAHGRTSVLLDALVAGEATPAVHVRATGGVITAVLEDAWIEGATGRGRDDSGPAQPPALEQVIPAAFLTGTGRLRLLVPGPQEAVVQARVLTPEGPLALPGEGVTRVKGGAVLDVDLAGLPTGSYAVHVRSDQPVTAAVLLERRGAAPTDASDLAWVPATAPVTILAGSPIPSETSAWLMLVGSESAWAATVHTVDANGAVTSRTVSGVADSVAVLEVSGSSAVWLAPKTGTVRAGLALQVPDPGGVLISVVGLSSAAVTTVDVPVREVSR